MKQGKCKFFNSVKGFGFLHDEESGTDYFVHATSLIDQIKENDKVSFELKEGKKGQVATNVRLLQL